MNKLKKRILEISYEYRLSHIGSCITAVDMIDKIYSVKKKEEPFILSNGHAGLALYVVLEKYEGQDAEKLWELHGVHPSRDIEHGIWASSGSLGHGIGIAVGMAMANRDVPVYVMMSDGEMMEGSVWESLRIANDYKLENLRVVVNANGYGAYQKIDTDWLDLVTQYFYPTLMVKTNMYDYPDYLQGLQGHYKTLNKKEYEKIVRT